jgi:hypothetical protein
MRKYSDQFDCRTTSNFHANQTTRCSKKDSAGRRIWQDPQICQKNLQNPVPLTSSGLPGKWGRPLRPKPAIINAHDTGSGLPTANPPVDSISMANTQPLSVRRPWLVPTRD